MSPHGTDIPSRLLGLRLLLLLLLLLLPLLPYSRSPLLLFQLPLVLLLPMPPLSLLSCLWNLCNAHTHPISLFRPGDPPLLHGLRCFPFSSFFIPNGYASHTTLHAQ